MTRILVIILLSLTAGPIQAQQPFSMLADSCFQYITLGDTLHFEQLVPRLADAYEQQEEPEIHALRQELLAMRNADQGIRFLLLEARKRSGKEGAEAQAVHARMKQIDNENAVKVRQIIDKYGWPGKDEIGEEANETLFLCIQHADAVTIQEKYLPILEKAVKEGAAEGWYYAFLTDRIRMNRGEKQIYGTQTITRNNGELNYVVPLENPDAVDSLRRSMGLEPMSVYLNGEWDLEAYKRNLTDIEQKYNTYTTSRKSAR